jgi:hypothetical protein
MEILVNHLRFYTFSFPCVFLKHWSLSLPTLPTPKEKRTKKKGKRKTRKWVLGFFNTLSMGWEKRSSKIFGIRTLPK